MTEFTLSIAGRAVAVRANYESTLHYCRDYLTQEAPEFTVTVTSEDITFERTKSQREDALEGIAPRSFSDSYLESIAVQRKLTQHLFHRDTLLFHGSVIAVDGQAYLFTAKSGTGKSTHTRLWREMLGDRAVMVNDDKPFLSLTPDGVIAHGSPWNGKHRLGQNLSVPLRAICVLERGQENRIRPIPSQEAVFMLLQQSSRPLDPRLMGKYMELLDRLSQSVRFYRLQCTPEPEAARVAFAEMSSPL